MEILIQLITESMLREPLINMLTSIGYQIEILDLQTDVTATKNYAATVTFIQAHLWSKMESKIQSSSTICMLGMPEWFYCWVDILLNTNRPMGYLTPQDLPPTIEVAFERLQHKEHYLSGTMQNILCKRSKVRQERLLNTGLSKRLTESELEILSLISDGYTTDQIAAKRTRSVHTVKTQRKNIRKKLKMVNGQRLAIFAGKKFYPLKTLCLIEKNTAKLEQICENTHKEV